MMVGDKVLTVGVRLVGVPVGVVVRTVGLAETGVLVGDIVIGICVGLLVKTALTGLRVGVDFKFQKTIRLKKIL
jgi:hypothetical protein